MCVWNSKHVVFRARFARAQIPNVQSFRDVYVYVDSRRQGVFSGHVELVLS